MSRLPAVAILVNNYDLFTRISIQYGRGLADRAWHETEALVADHAPPARPAGNGSRSVITDSASAAELAVSCLRQGISGDRLGLGEKAG